MAAKDPAEVFRDYATDGVPGSGAHDPIKADIRELLASLGGTAQIWTPTFTFATPGTLSVTYTARQGRYWHTPGTDIVRFTCYLDFDTNAFTGVAGAARITGLPIAAAVAGANADDGVDTTAISVGRIQNVNYNGAEQITAWIDDGETYIRPRLVANSNFGGDLTLIHVPPSTVDIRMAFSGFYQVTP